MLAEIIVHWDDKCALSGTDSCSWQSQWIWQLGVCSAGWAPGI